jgi:hypothetical protein
LLPGRELHLIWHWLLESTILHHRWKISNTSTHYISLSLNVRRSNYNYSVASQFYFIIILLASSIKERSADYSPETTKIGTFIHFRLKKQHCQKCCLLAIFG